MSATAMYRLRFLDHTHPLPNGSQVMVGRGANCHVRLDGDLVSRTHAAIHVEDQDVVLHDLGSMNGTFVNDRRVTAPRTLNSGDQIRIAFFKLVFEERSPSSSATPTLQLIYCVGCQAALTADSHFCVHCGTEVIPQLLNSGCTQCGKAVSLDTTFCACCGYNLAS
ncbi:MAG TPA: FHA domain-containing protein [Myxococcales bacterium]|nr:FHA domain-containing protein [Myxococcales bacterium]